MKTKTIFISLLFLSASVFSQSFDEILNTIEENNKDIQAGKKYIESKSYEYKKDNLPEGPKLTYGYFPDNSSVPGTREVFEVSQSFQMPYYYINHKAYANLMINQEEYNHLILKQDVLNEVKILLNEYVYLMKKTAINDKRLKFADDIHNAYLIRLEVGDANALEVNKTKLHLMQVKKEEKLLKSELLIIKENIKKLNGGNDLDISVDDYQEQPLIELDSLLFERLSSDPELLSQQKAAEASNRQLKITKNLQLPKFSLGYSSETIVNERFKGVIVGVSIPLWSSKRTIQKAKIESEYFDLSAISLNESKVAETRIRYDQILTLKENLENYQSVLGSVNSQELLNVSLKNGEISVIEFFIEMFYYYEIYDEYLMVERDYYQALSELYKYRL